MATPGENDDRTDPGIVAPRSGPQPAAATPPVRLPDLGGAVNALMRDPSVTEIMINDTRNVMVERDGLLSFAGFRIETAEELARIVRALLEATDKLLTPESPLVDGFLPDGSRIHIVAHPLVLRGPCVTIRKFPSRAYSLEDLIQANTLTQRMAYFLNAAIVGRLNVVISGGTGSGKTTLLNAMAAYIPKNERIVTIEDTRELRLGQANIVHMQTKPASPGGAAISARELLANALRMRPDRIIVGECRRGEALDMLQAMNTGHEGSLTTVHANSPRESLYRLETLCMMSGVELPLAFIRRQIASSIDLIVQIRRMRSGARKVTAITEVTGMEGDTITLQDIFECHEKDGAPGVATAQFHTTGNVPTLLDRLRANGVDLPANYFAPGLD